MWIESFEMAKIVAHELFAISPLQPLFLREGFGSGGGGRGGVGTLSFMRVLGSRGLVGGEEVLGGIMQLISALVCGLPRSSFFHICIKPRSLPRSVPLPLIQCVETN